MLGVFGRRLAFVIVGSFAVSVIMFIAVFVA